MIFYANALSSYSAKVRIVLAVKDIDVEAVLAARDQPIHLPAVLQQWLATAQHRASARSVLGPWRNATLA